jgi:AmmeMemoRadiSam system protein B/AmmeMemoRadiSam system protein A
MTTVRKPAAAGRFYPQQADELRETIRRFLDVPQRAPAHPKGIIVPHAGYVYSGPIAASAYARLSPLRGQIERVVLLGPAHFVPVRGLAAPSVEFFETPLGPLEVDQRAIECVLGLPQVERLDAAHAREHSLEVHLPFLQEVLGDFRIVPLLVGQATTQEVAELIETLWGGPETLFVISSDLSHFHDHDTAARLDAATARDIEQLRFEDLTGERACGYLPVGGMLDVARRRGLSVTTLDVRNSGDTAGDWSRVVGYGAWLVVDPAASGGLTAGEEQTLLEIAEDSIRFGLAVRRPLDLWQSEYSPRLQLKRATFVTLLHRSRLRGCMGSLSAEEPLVVNVARNAYSAAFRDPRFDPVSEAELDELELHISLLEPAEPLMFASEADLLAQMRPGIDGLTLYEHGRRGTLLPAVWEHVTDPRDFLAHLKHKAGLPLDYWSDTLVVERYTAISIPSTRV